MVNGLHARKRVQTDVGVQDIPESPLSGDSSRYRKARNRFLPNFLRSEVGYAVEAVGAFLAFGFFFGYIIMHNQHRKVALQVIRNPMAHAGAALTDRGGFRHHFYSDNPRTVTVILPSVVNPNGRKRRLNSIFETWGPAARAVYVVHNVSEFPLGRDAVIGQDMEPEDPYSYPQLLLVPPSITIDDGLARLNYVIRTVYERIQPEFAFFVNDHTYVIQEHLCAYLEDKEPDEDMYDGHAMKNDKDVFNSGAAGYILSRETMRKLVQKWDEENETCLLKHGSKWLQGNPGLVTTKCLKQELSIEAKDTRYQNKWHRFHAFPLTRMVTGAVDEWYRNKHMGMDKLMNTDASYNKLLSGVDCCAPDTVSFHYVEYRESQALFTIREALTDNPQMSDHDVKTLMLAQWPKNRKEIGGYSRGLPKETDGEGWNTLLKVIRKISTRKTQRDC